MQHRVFLSYAHEDLERARRLRGELEAADLQVIIDETVDLRPEQELRREFRRLVGTSHAMVLMLTRHSATSDFVKLEYEEAKKKNVPVVALVMGDLGQWPWWFERLNDVPYVEGKSRVVQHLIDEIVARVTRRVRRAKVISFFNMKGGVGKTTLAAQFAARLAKGSDAGRAPLSTLMIDLDPQQSLTELFVSAPRLHESHEVNHSIVGLCEPSQIGRRREQDPSAVILTPPSQPPDYSAVPVPLGTGEASIGNPRRFDIVAGDFEAIRYADELGVDRNMLVYHFEHALNSFLGKYDVIVLDCNPSVSPLTHCALRADHIVLPITPDDFGRRGFRFVTRFLQRHLDHEDWPRLHAVLNKVYQSKKPKTQVPFLKALRAGNDAFGSGMEELSAITLKLEIPLDRDLEVPSIQLGIPTRSAHDFVEAAQRANPDMERFVDELMGRIAD